MRGLGNPNAETDSMSLQNITGRPPEAIHPGHSSAGSGESWKHRLRLARLVAAGQPLNEIM